MDTPFTHNARAPRRSRGDGAVLVGTSEKEGMDGMSMVSRAVVTAVSLFCTHDLVQNIRPSFDHVSAASIDRGDSNITNYKVMYVAATNSYETITGIPRGIRYTGFRTHALPAIYLHW